MKETIFDIKKLHTLETVEIITYQVVQREVLGENTSYQPY